MKYIKVTRSDADGSYIDTVKHLQSIVEGEFDNIENMTPGQTVTLTVVEIEEGAFKLLEEFSGW